VACTGLGRELVELMLLLVGLLCLRRSAAWAAMDRVSEEVLNMDCHPPLPDEELAAAAGLALDGWQSWSLVWR